MIARKNSRAFTPARMAIAIVVAFGLATAGVAGPAQAATKPHVTLSVPKTARADLPVTFHYKITHYPKGSVATLQFKDGKNWIKRAGLKRADTKITFVNDIAGKHTYRIALKPKKGKTVYSSTHTVTTTGANSYIKSMSYASYNVYANSPITILYRVGYASSDSNIQLQRRDQNGLRYSTVATLDRNQTSYTIAGGLPSGVWFYRVRIENAGFTISYEATFPLYVYHQAEPLTDFVQNGPSGTVDVGGTAFPAYAPYDGTNGTDSVALFPFGPTCSSAQLRIGYVAGDGGGLPATVTIYGQATPQVISIPANNVVTAPTTYLTQSYNTMTLNTPGTGGHLYFDGTGTCYEPLDIEG